MTMNDINLFTLDADHTLIDAANVISKNYARCVVVMQGDKVIGVLSEGDILRALIQNASTLSPIKTFVNHNFKMLTEKSISKAAEFIKEYGITLIPIVDKDLKLLDVITLQDVMDELV